MTSNDYAYIGGFFDGEGCVGIYRAGGTAWNLRVQISQTSTPDTSFLLSGLVDLFGGSVADVKTKARPALLWQVSGPKALAFLKAIQPYVFLKREQVELAIEFQEGKPVKAIGPDQRARGESYSLRLKEMKRL